MKQSIAVIVGTRPEAIKMAPVVRALFSSSSLMPIVISTGQQRELARQALASVGIQPAIDLDLMSSNQSLAALTSRVIDSTFNALSESRCVACLVHGDTTTALGGALAAFYSHIPLGHVEAGLRTYDFDRPWPEEMNRRLIDPICRWCFAPTTLSGENLRKENISGDRIFVTGNTVIDALIECRSRIGAVMKSTSDRRMILVTGHRRESFGHGFQNICEAIRRLVTERDDVRVVYPVHLNPNVQEPVYRILANHPQIHLQDPVSYEAFVRLMDESYLILTDSGGVQEEAPSLGKPVLVMRSTTERPEGVKAGTCQLVGTDSDRIVEACNHLLDNRDDYQRRSTLNNPYGDGFAAERIVKILEGSLY